MNQSSQDEFRNSFFEECEELLEAMQEGFDRLAEDVTESETMNAIFRAVHSIKGGAGAFRLDGLVGFAHHFETALDKLRSGDSDFGDGTLDLIRLCGDHLADLVEKSRHDDNASFDNTSELMVRLTSEFALPDADEEVEEPEFEPMTLDFGPLDDDDPDQFTGPQGFAITFSAAPGLFRSGNDPVPLFNMLRRFGEVEIETDLEAIPTLAELDPDSCHIAWNLRIITTENEGAIREIFDFVDQDCTLSIVALPDGGPAHGDLDALDGLPSLGGEADAQAPVEDAKNIELPNLDELDALPDLQANEDGDAAALSLKEPSSVSEDDAPLAKAPKGPSEKPAAAKAGGTVRVDLERVDKLINLVGEMVIKEAMLSQSVSLHDFGSESDISVGLDNLAQLASEIQEGVMAIRAQPVKPLFQRMSRIVRETSAATGKPVRFVTEGEDAEVDKTVVERLVDPLTHMIRNAIDHGLESPEKRKIAGKPAEGTITLSAAHRSGRVVIEVSDDGGGINRRRVKEIATERGLIAEGTDLSDQDIDNLLFQPGFSSKDEVSELSGRGVGLDVVRSEIAGLGGRVSIQSNPGAGSIFTISLPLTLAVLEGMVISLANETMVIPLSAIQETMQPKEAEIDTISSGHRVLRCRDGIIPIIDLGVFFGFRGPEEDLTDRVFLLIETASHQRFALVVDRIQDQRQVVIKSLETNYRQIGGVAAATILGDGRIALIVDADNIVSSATSGEATAAPTFDWEM